MEYKFTTRSVFLLGQFLKHFEGELDQIIALLNGIEGLKSGEDILSKVPVEKVMGIIIRVVSSASQAEEIAVQLLANGMELPHEDVRKMDGYEFLNHFRAYLSSIDWKKLLGESLGLVLSPPEPAAVANPVQQESSNP